MSENPSPFLTVPELAALLRVTPNTVYSWTQRVGPEAIPRYRAGKRLVFDEVEAVRWFRETQAVGGTARGGLLGGPARPSRRRGRRFDRNRPGSVASRPSRPEGAASAVPLEGQGSASPSRTTLSEAQEAGGALPVPSRSQNSRNGGAS